MKDKVFLDSNIVIYAYSDDDPLKRSIVQDILNKHDIMVISTQVINEFINVMIKKKKLDYGQISLAVNELFSVLLVDAITMEVIQKAINISIKHGYSYFDSLMLSSAIMSGCSIFYSEDMHNRHVVEKHLEIVNPFK